MRRGQNEAAPLMKINKNKPSAIATPRVSPAAVSHTHGSPLRERPVVVKDDELGGMS